MSLESAPLLEVRQLTKHFPVRSGLGRGGGRVHAVDDVSFELEEGETLGLVGESGCGKTTLARCVVRLLDPTAGTIAFRGQDITALKGRALGPARRQLQMVFQDPYSSLNARRRVAQILGTPLRLRGVSRSDVNEHVRCLLDRVGLQPEHLDRFPDEFSGGERQRIGIARALALEPRLLVLDEPVSALDVSVRAQIVNLLAELRRELGLTYLFVAHDLSVVRHVSDRVAVMYLGKLVELSPAEELYTNPIHPYTAALLAAVPVPDPRESRLRRRSVAGGEPPDPINPPQGCRFHPRCFRATDVCREVEPPLLRHSGAHLAACHHPLDSGGPVE